MNRQTRIIVSMLSVLLIALLVLQTPLLTHSRGFIWNIWVNTLARLFAIGPLQIDNDALTQMHRLLSDNIRLQGELQDYRELRQQLAQNSFESLRPLSAAIASRPLDTFHSQYLLNRGLQDGVILGAPVVVYGSTLIGFITETHDRSSIVQLLVHPNTALTATTIPKDQGSVPARGLLQGQQYTALLLTTIPRDLPVQTGEDVVTVAKDTMIPAGLVIGKIATVKSRVNEAYQEANVTFSYDIDRLTAVTILLPP